MRRSRTNSWAGREGLAYERISNDPDDLFRGVTRQNQDNFGWGDEQGAILLPDAAVGKPSFRDDNISASKYSTKVRKAYNRLVKAIEENDQIRFVVCWQLDRFLRRPDELEPLIKLADKRPNGLWLIVDGREFDLTDMDDQYQLRDHTNRNANESDRISRRTRKAKAADRANGVQAAGAPYGWTNGGRDRHPTEGDAVVEMVEMFLAGHGLNAIARSLNDRGVPTKRGKHWASSSVRATIKHPRHYGMHAHTDAKTGLTVILDRKHHTGLLPAAKFDQVQATLDQRHLVRPPTRTGLLTGLVHCGRCGSVMYRNSESRTGRPVLRCDRAPNKPLTCGRCAIGAVPVEEAVAEAVWYRVDNLRLARATSATNPKNDAGALQARLDELEDAERTNAVEEASGRMSKGRAYALDQAITAERDDIRRRLANLMSARTLAAYVGRPGALKADWSKKGGPLTVAVKREITREALALGKVRVVVYPATKVSPAFDPDRVKLVSDRTLAKIRATYARSIEEASA